MPRRNRAADLDFEIHVDPSCLSEPMDDIEKKEEQPPVQDAPKVEDVETKPEVAGDAEVKDTEEKVEDQPEPEAEVETKTEPEPVPEPTAEPAAEAKAEEEDGGATPKPETKEDEHDTNDDTTAAAEAQDAPTEPVADKDDDDKEEPAVAETTTIDNDDTLEVKEAEAEAETPAEPQEVEPENVEEVKEEAAAEAPIEPEISEAAEPQDSKQAFITPSHSEQGSRRESMASTTSSASYDPSRRASGRTEALIHAAARNIIAQIDRDHPRDSLASVDEDGSDMAHSEPASSRNSDAHESVAESYHSSDNDRATDDGAESSSHHDNEVDDDDDVFSDHSPRSSVGSLSESDHTRTKKVETQSPRMSGISELSQYDNEDFVPTIRGAPRPAFRSPSSVKALQMSSPPASVIGSPRSSRRGLSRIGSPSLSAQYSPKKTPPRFKRATPPLVLLHVTLLPLRWGWGEVLEQATNDELSHDAKTLREGWRLLQDRMGDTTVERGILLPHPQNDYEILEERLLEALELPMRRRARILECGHYLGPSNEMEILEEESDEEDYDHEGVGSRRGSQRQSTEQKTHWCSTCRSEIRYDALGPGKIFRVKVYASNGLMKGGAWEACWKEMERVDVELEPIVGPVLQAELDLLLIEQERRYDEQEERLEREAREKEEEMEREEFEREAREREEELRKEEREREALEREALEREEFEREALEREALEREEFEREALEREALEREALERETLEREELERRLEEEAAKQAEEEACDLSHLDEEEKSEELHAESSKSPRTSDVKVEVEDAEESSDAQDRGIPEEHVAHDDTLPVEEEAEVTAEDKAEAHYEAPSVESEVEAEAEAEPEPLSREMPDTTAHNEAPSRRQSEKHHDVYDDYIPQQTESHYQQEHQPEADYTTRDFSGPSPEARQEAMKNASLQQLVVESARVLMQDKKNIIIGLLSLLVLVVAMRGGQPQYDPQAFQTLIQKPEVAATVTVTELPVTAATMEAAIESASSSVAFIDSEPSIEPVVDDVVPEVHESVVEEQEPSSVQEEAVEESTAPEDVEVEAEVETPKAETETMETREVETEAPEEIEVPVEEAHVAEEPSEPDNSPEPSASDELDPCASCTRSSSDPESTDVEASSEEQVQARRETETETIISERIIFETVTQVATETIRVTETVGHPLATQSAGDEAVLGGQGVTEQRAMKSVEAAAAELEAVLEEAMSLEKEDVGASTEAEL